ncbi:MAG: hypothetical protein ABR975_07005 [Vulcanimicrobiaceae bacterium]|jgi:hypothetical protein
MLRLRPILVTSFLGMGLALAGCGGGGSHGAALPPGQSPGAGSTPSPYNGQTAQATLTVTIPAPTGSSGSATTRSPKYIPASVRSVSILVLEVGGTPVADTPATTNVTPGSAPCSTVTSADYTCTITVSLPIGTDNVQIGTYDAINAGGNLISQTIYSATVVEGHSNTFGSAATPITLDANPGTISVVALSGPTGTYPNFTANGTGSETYTISVVDKHGTAFGSQPGQPTMTHAFATGTGASASISGSTLTLTPPTSGNPNVVVDADPAGSKIVSTTLSSSPAAGATSFTVASTSSMFVGMNLVLDYETFSGTTLIQETAKITNISGSTITVSTGLAHAHSSGAQVTAYSDNLSPSTAPFTVTIATTVIAPVGENDSASGSKALVYNTSFALQTGTLTNSTATYDIARFDTADQLFIVDQSVDTVYRSQWTAGSGFGSVTTYSGIPANQPGNVAFDVSSSGAVGVENFSGETPQLDAYAAGSSSGPTAFTTSTLSPGTWNTGVDEGFPTIAVLSDTSGNAFGYAYSVWDTTDTSHDQIVVTSGTSEQDINSSAIVSEFANDPTVGVMAWDVGLQSLFYANSDTGSGSTYAVLEFPRNGTTGATLSTSPTTIASVAGYPQSIASSQGSGDYVAVAWGNSAGGTTISIYFYNGSTWSLTGTINNNGTTIDYFTSMHFIPSGNLIVSNSDSAGDVAQLMQFTTAGSQVGSTYSVVSDFGGTYTINDVAVSY